MFFKNFHSLFLTGRLHCTAAKLTALSFGQIPLFIHPVKSMRGIGLTHALADVSGLAFDRIFMITEPDGTFITARQFPRTRWQ